jgi:threonine/homoserine/homoserine lactone efflux protein
MTFEILTTFIAVVIVFCIIPGPTVILVIGQALSYGQKSVMPLVLGVLVGDFVAMSLSLLGLGVILATSATLFFILKWLGVLYLIYLGIKTWRDNPIISNINTQKDNHKKINMFKSAFLVTALNPKDIMFFVAFLPQFVSSQSPALPQLLILMFTFLFIVAVNISFYTIFAGKISNKIQNYNARKRLNKIGGGSLITAGLITATIQRTSNN